MRCSRVLSPAKDVPDDDFAQIDHDFPQPSVLVEQFVHARVVWRRPFGCREAALVRDESRFWSLMCHRSPSLEAAATIEPPARKCWRFNAANQLIERRNSGGEFCRKFVCSVTFASRVAKMHGKSDRERKPSVPIPKFARACGTFRSELRNRRTLATR